MNSWLISIYEDLSITWADNIHFLTLNINGTSYHFSFVFLRFVNLLAIIYCVLLTYYIVRFVYKLLVRRKERI